MCVFCGKVRIHGAVCYCDVITSADLFLEWLTRYYYLFYRYATAHSAVFISQAWNVFTSSARYSLRSVLELSIASSTSERASLRHCTCMYGMVHTYNMQSVVVDAGGSVSCKNFLPSLPKMDTSIPHTSSYRTYFYIYCTVCTTGIIRARSYNVHTSTSSS